MGKLNQAIVALVEHEGKVLVGKKEKTLGHPLSEAWHIPGGSLKGCESDVEGLTREIWEEAGIKIRVKEFLGKVHVAETKTIAKWYLCEPLTHDLKYGDDLTDVKYVERSAVPSICSAKGVSLWPPKVLEYFKLQPQEAEAEF